MSWAANAVLFVTACFLAADTANAVFASLLAEPETVVAPPTPVETRGDGTRRNDRELIVRRNLFNAATVEGTAGELEISEDLEETKLPLELLGTAAADDPTYAWAAVQDRETRETLVVTIGDVLKQKAEVLRIERRRLVLREDGEPRELTFGDEEAQPAAVARTRPRARTRASRSRDAASAVRQLANDRFEVPREDVERVLSDPADILSQARFLPKYDGQQMIGFQVSGLKPDSVLKEFGLQDGDLITEFNGIPIDSPAETARLLQEFNESDVVNLVAEDAQGNEREINVDLTTE